jgi:hypothetical protein
MTTKPRLCVFTGHGIPDSVIKQIENVVKVEDGGDCGFLIKNIKLFSRDEEIIEFLTNHEFKVIDENPYKIHTQKTYISTRKVIDTIVILEDIVHYYDQKIYYRDRIFLEYHPLHKLELIKIE